MKWNIVLKKNSHAFTVVYFFHQVKFFRFPAKSKLGFSIQMKKLVEEWTFSILRTFLLEIF